MRQDGIAGFPDPTLTPPSDPADYSAVRNGVVIVIPEVDRHQLAGVRAGRDRMQLQPRPVTPPPEERG
jgi:hypothetical protein